MKILSTLDIILNTKNNWKIVNNIFLRYINKHCKGKFFWISIKIDFKY